MKLGVTLASLGLSVRRGLAEARRLGLTGVMMDATGDLAPDRLSDTGKRELRHLLSSNGVELTALGCPLRHGLDEAANLQQRLDRVRQVMALSFDLATRITVVQAGQVSDDPATPRSTLMRDSLLALGQYGDRIGTTLALRTGLEPGTTLQALLDRLDTGGVGVAYDPGALLTNGFDPVEQLAPIKNRIVHVLAKDARRVNVSRTVEVPVGHGDVDWMLALGTLGALEYRGWVVIDCTDRPADVATSASFLRRLL